MITAFSKKLNLRISDGWGCGASFHLDEFNKAKIKFEVFEKGKGRYKLNKKDFVIEEIPDLESHLIFPVKEYYEKYGKHCALNGLNKFMATICTDSHLNYCLSFNVPQSFCTEFYENFKINVDYFRVDDKFHHWLGIWSFDIVAFDGWLKHNAGYTEERHGSMSDFLTKRFGSGFVERFRNNLLK